MVLNFQLGNAPANLRQGFPLRNTPINLYTSESEFVS